jgi:hypothetical protein
MFYNMFGHMSRMSPATSTLWMLTRHVALIFSWGRASVRIENVSPFFEAYHLLMDYIVPSVCVTESDVPDLETDQKIKKYVERYRMPTLEGPEKATRGG